MLHWNVKEYKYKNFPFNSLTAEWNKIRVDTSRFDVSFSCNRCAIVVKIRDPEDLFLKVEPNNYENNIDYKLKQNKNSHAHMLRMLIFFVKQSYFSTIHLNVTLIAFLLASILNISENVDKCTLFLIIQKASVVHSDEISTECHSRTKFEFVLIKINIYGLQLRKRKKVQFG